STDIHAPPERVWQVIMDVERWHEWTPSISSIERLQPGELKAGDRVRIKQPRLPSVVWTVSKVEPGRLMEWRYDSPGSHSVAWHAVEPSGTGSKATLGIEQRGLFFAVAGRFLDKRTREYVDMELQGLKRRSEAG